jgi:hypothetical protein
MEARPLVVYTKWPWSNRQGKGAFLSPDKVDHPNTGKRGVKGKGLRVESKARAFSWV